MFTNVKDIQSLPTLNIRKSATTLPRAKSSLSSAVRLQSLLCKEGGADPANNSKLRDVIAKAKANNMPNDTIDRGIKKAEAMPIP